MHKKDSQSIAVEIIRDYKRDNLVLKMLLLASILVNIVIVIILN